MHASTRIYYKTDLMGPWAACTWANVAWYYILQLYLINISYIHILLQACRVPSAFTFAGVGQEQQHWSWGRTLMKKWISNVCLCNLKPWLFMPAVRHLLHWTRGHGSVFTLNMQESLTMRWLCHRRWMLCRNAHRPVHTSTAGKTYY